MYYTISDLKKLVNALSGAEKRYFTLFCNAFQPSGIDSYYKALFRTLANPKTEISEFSEGISGEVKTTAKKGLFANILRSLRLYHHNQSAETTIQNCLTDIEVLYRHSLPEQGLHRLRKAAALAKENEKFGLLLQLLEWERRLNIVLDIPTRDNSDIKKEEKQVLAKLQQIMELESIYAQAKELKKQYGYVKGVMKKNLNKETINAKGMPSEKECLSNKAIFYFNFIHALYYWMTFNHQSAFEYSQRLLSPTIQVVLPNDYVDGILEHITSCVCLGKFDAALKGLQAGANYISDQKLNQSHAFAVRMFYYEVSYQIIIFNYTGDKDRLEATIQDAEEKLKRYDALLSRETKQVIVANLMNAYLGTGNLDKVNETWDTLFHKQSQKIRRDIYDDLYLFRLFNLMQNEFYWMIRSMASSASRYYRKFKDFNTHFALELKVVAVFQRNMDFSDKQNKTDALIQIREIIGNYLSGLKGANKFQEQYTLYEIWTESLISGEPFHIEARLWYQRFCDMQL